MRTYIIKQNNKHIINIDIFKYCQKISRMLFHVILITDFDDLKKKSLVSGNRFLIELRFCFF